MTTRRRLLLALVAALAAAGCIVASFLTWLSLPDGAGGRTEVSGWGLIGGGSQIAGENINDAMNGNATFRPGLVALSIGAVALLAASALTVRAGRPRPHRVSGAVLAVCGLAGAVQGTLRVLRPDSAGVLAPGEGSAGVGSWLTLTCGVALLAVAAAVLRGRR